LANQVKCGKKPNGEYIKRSGVGWRGRFFPIALPVSNSQNRHGATCPMRVLAALHGIAALTIWMSQPSVFHNLFPNFVLPLKLVCFLPIGEIGLGGLVEYY